jgi:hypothetical protein
MQTHQPTARTKTTCKCRPSLKRLKGFEPSTFCMASSRWVCHGPAKCLQTNDFRQARPRAGVPRIVRRYRGFRQGTDNERSLALGGSAGSRVAVESASASTVREPDSCCSSRRRPRRTNPAAHRGRGSTSACPQEQQRRASRFSAGRHLCLVPLQERERRVPRHPHPWERETLLAGGAGLLVLVQQQSRLVAGLGAAVRREQQRSETPQASLWDGCRPADASTSARIRGERCESASTCCRAYRAR